MSPSIPRTAAAIMLFTSGAFLAVIAFGLVVARMVIDQAALTVTAKDAALVADLATLAPFVAVFGLLDVVAAIGVVLGTGWGRPVGYIVAAIGAFGGAVALTLLILGHDPFANVASDRALGGIEVAAAFTAYFVVVIVALAMDRVSGRARSTLAAA